MNLLVVISWFFLALWTRSIAQKKGRNPHLWFGIGFLLGLIGVIIIYFLKPRAVRSRTPAPAEIPDNLQNKLWFYLKEDRTESNSMSFQALKELWKKKILTPQTYIWCEEWPEWKKVADLKDIFYFLAN